MTYSVSPGTETHAMVITQQLGIKFGLKYLEALSACPQSVGNEL